MKKSFIAPAGQSAPRGAYTPAIRVDLGAVTMLFVTGQLALDPQGRVVAPHDATAQTEFIFGLLAQILAEAGMSFADVVRAQTYLTNIADFAKFTAVRDRHLGESRPASTLLEVKGLAHPGCCVEIELTAIKGHFPA
jgi:enamine deaminase RidA (YjgF/YER057c/UK114 family)